LKSRREYFIQGGYQDFPLHSLTALPGIKQKFRLMNISNWIKGLLFMIFIDKLLHVHTHAFYFQIIITSFSVDYARIRHKSKQSRLKKVSPK
jgi:hypothetical protein